MNEQDILNLIKKDEWMMKVLQIAEGFNFPDWVIGAGFIRNKVWNYLHGYSKLNVGTNDIDLVYYDSKRNNQKADEKLSQKLSKQTGFDWDVVNEVYAHKWNNLPPYKSMWDAISLWPETATCIGVRLRNGKLTLIAPHGIGDLTNLIVRPNPIFPGGLDLVKERAKKKEWFEKWPKLIFEKV